MLYQSVQLGLAYMRPSVRAAAWTLCFSYFMSHHPELPLQLNNMSAARLSGAEHARHNAQGEVSHVLLSRVFLVFMSSWSSLTQSLFCSYICYSFVGFYARPVCAIV